MFLQRHELGTAYEIIPYFRPFVRCKLQSTTDKLLCLFQNRLLVKVSVSVLHDDADGALDAWLAVTSVYPETMGCNGVVAN